MRKVSFLVVFFACSLEISFAQQGKNGAETVTINNTIVNEYATLTADAVAGSTSITVSNNSLNTNGRFLSSLAAGDLIMIIQTQGATINGNNTGDSTWGAITTYNNCGLYEFAQVKNVSGGVTINLLCALQNNYSAAGRTQVVRMPRYTTLTINANDTLTCDAWELNNVAQGGIVAVEVQNGTTINAGGAISASAKGFRGGQTANSASIQFTDTFAATDIGYGAEKGESIAGFEADYTPYGGMYGRGAPANGGGGGNSWNSGGGGGANAGDINDWTGNGNPDVSTANYITAWNLEYTGFANSTSSGGGRGGYSSSNNSQDPLTDGPGNDNWDNNGSLWGGRNNTGGKGGRPLDYSTGRLFFGGGAGAGHEDNGNGGNGGAGGGLVYVLSYGTIAGSGNIVANGQDGSPNTQTPGDAPGGGGAGGTIILNSSGSITGITATANGGSGGIQTITVSEAEGPGGGGGGGYIALSNPGITTQLLGGANGTTTSSSMVLFPPNGATKGGNGVDSTAIPICFLQPEPITGPITVCSGTSNTYTITSSCPASTYAWTLPAGWTGSSTTNTITAIAGASGGTISVSINNGGCPIDTTLVVTVSPSPTAPNLPLDTTVCSLVNVTLNAGSTTFNYLWSTGATTPSITVTNAGTYKLQVYNACDTLNDSTTIILEQLPKVSLGKDTSVCNFANYILKANADSTVTAYLWSTGATTPAIPILAAGTYWVKVTNNCGSALDTIIISSCEGGYVIPNAFIPTSSETNNAIGLIHTGSGNVQLLEFSIFNRWGQLIFSTADDQEKWDGRFNGLPEPIGVYVYYVKYIDTFGITKLLKGNITLLR